MQRGLGDNGPGLMSHETGFTGAEALPPNPRAIHFAIATINRRLNASVRRQIGARRN